MNPVETLETSKAVNSLKQLQALGQSIWLDYIRRDLLTGGELKRLIEEDGLRGMTSNPAIFEKAIAGSTDYTAALETIERREDQEPIEIYEQLAIEDIKMAGPCAKVNMVLSEEPRWDGMPVDADPNRRSFATLVPTLAIQPL